MKTAPKRHKSLPMHVQRQLLSSLKESQEILRDLYAGRSVSGRVLDCIDSNRAAINAAETS